MRPERSILNKALRYYVKQHSFSCFVEWCANIRSAMIAGHMVYRLADILVDICPAMRAGEAKQSFAILHRLPPFRNDFVFNITNFSDCARENEGITQDFQV